MLDIETFGTGNNAAIASIGACRFNPFEQQTGDTFYTNVDVFDSGDIDKDTVYWWLQQDEAAIKALCDPQPRPLKHACSSFQEFARNAKYLWSNGPTFDEVILRSAFDRVGYAFPIHFRGSRCCRTIWHLVKALGCKHEKPTRMGLKHNAVDDAVYQARCVNAAYDWLNVMTRP